jgi:uncharacterized protein YlzI (FlbEa/FlbD family)
MKGWIILNVLVCTEESTKLEDMGLNPKDTYMFKKEFIQVSNISSIQLEPNTDGNTVMYVNGTYSEIKESCKEIINKIRINLKNFES